MGVTPAGVANCAFTDKNDMFVKDDVFASAIKLTPEYNNVCDKNL